MNLRIILINLDLFFFFQGNHIFIESKIKNKECNGSDWVWERFIGDTKNS